jgi:EAL domain-containing protein (putative c-di-GMP-specific phosphodiesterase class I)
VPPNEFIPIAESNGLITSIGTWVLRTAVRQLKCWSDEGMPPMTMAVNVSPVQFRQQNLPEMVVDILREENVAPELLELELTESVAADDPTTVLALMSRLHVCGVRLAIDDFGTGFSSLNALKLFNVDKLKIDQSFIRSLATDAKDQAIVTAIIALARGLGLETIAEGVETAEQMEHLRRHGCDEMQGYLFSKALPPGEFSEFVKAKALAFAL